MASFSDVHATRTAALFHQPHFRCYTNPDPIGVEAAGALKNVSVPVLFPSGPGCADGEGRYAIASGCAEGLGFSSNTRAGLVTRSLNEMTKVGVAFGANPLTFVFRVASAKLPGLTRPRRRFLSLAGGASITSRDRR